MFADDNIKHFEELFLRGLDLQKMGINNTQEYLIEKDKDNE